jgi:hypothetical protein
MAGLTDEERLRLKQLWKHLCGKNGHHIPPLAKRDLDLIDWAVAVIRPDKKDPRPGITALETRRVCLLAAKKMLETGCTKEAAKDLLLGGTAKNMLLGGDEPGVRYAFKKGAIEYATLYDYLYKAPKEWRPEWYLKGARGKQYTSWGFIKAALKIESDIEDWEVFTNKSITDGAPENW